MILKTKKELSGTKVLKWINEGERKGFHKRPTCASRSELWYDLGVWKKPDFIWSDAYSDRYAVYETMQTWADKRFFFITLHDKKNLLTLQAYLNGTIIPLLIEIDGITNLGEGAVYTNVYWLQKLMVPSRRKGLEDNISKCLSKLKSRPVESVFEELGAESAAEVSVEKVKSDRRELDKIVMGDILGLTEGEQLDVYRAVIDLVKSRLEKAKSLGKKKKTKEGVDIDALVKIVLEKVGGETLGTFYKQNVLSLKSLSTRTLPRVAEVVHVGQELFDWYLYLGKKHIKCTSELEARYLKVWAEAGVEKIKVPREERELKRIVPELEKLKARIDKTVKEHLNSIIDNKTRKKIAHFVWAELVR